MTVKPTACPYPFPIRWHRNMAQVIAEEASGSNACADTRQTLEENGPDTLLEAAPGPDLDRERTAMLANDSPYARNGLAASFSERAQEAWRLHRAFMLMERAVPELAGDSLFWLLRDEAYERFERAMAGAA